MDIAGGTLKDSGAESVGYGQLEGHWGHDSRLEGHSGDSGIYHFYRSSRSWLIASSGGVWGLWPPRPWGFYRWTNYAGWTPARNRNPHHLVGASRLRLDGAHDANHCATLICKDDSCKPWCR